MGRVPKLMGWAFVLGVMLVGWAQGAEPPVDYEPYTALLQRYVDDRGLVNYKGLKADREPLDRFVRGLGALERERYEALSDERQIALLINAYNAFALKLIVDNYPIESSFLKSFVYPENSIRQIEGAFDGKTFELMGRKVTLDGIEHGMLRENFDEPRIHMAVNCASMSCPPLRREPYRGPALDEQLDDQSRRFLSHRRNFRIDREAETVYLSSIFKWFGTDFIGKYKPSEGFGGKSEKVRAVLKFVSGYVGPDEAGYLRTGGYGIEYIDYDWSLNEQ